MKAKFKEKSIIPQYDVTKPLNRIYLNKSVVLKSYKYGGNKSTVLISLRYVQDDFECFSQWSRQEMKIFWEFNRSIHNYSWQDILAQGGRNGSKVGFGYTKISHRQYPESIFISTFSPELDVFELRLNAKMRVHGFRDDALFYICWLDRNHKICS